jgi:hypothetical protein
VSAALRFLIARRDVVNGICHAQTLCLEGTIPKPQPEDEGGVGTDTPTAGEQTCDNARQIGGE